MAATWNEQKHTAKHYGSMTCHALADSCVCCMHAATLGNQQQQQFEVIHKAEHQQQRD
jgi:hypothetical protein